MPYKFIPYVPGEAEERGGKRKSLPGFWKKENALRVVCMNACVWTPMNDGAARQRGERESCCKLVFDPTFCGHNTFPYLGAKKSEKSGPQSFPCTHFLCLIVGIHSQVGEREREKISVL